MNRPHRCETTPDGGWRCLCGTQGDATGLTAEEHLTRTARAAFRRLDDGRVWACMAVSAATRIEHKAVRMLGRHWFRDGSLRRFITPYYDGYGVLSGRLRWEELGAAVAAGEFDHHPHLLTLQAALSLRGVYALHLSDLEKVTDREDRANLFEIIADLLDIPATPATSTGS